MSKDRAYRMTPAEEEALADASRRLTKAGFRFVLIFTDQAGVLTNAGPNDAVKMLKAALAQVEASAPVDEELLH